MRHVKQWVRLWTKCAVATWLVHTATGLGWLQALACVALVLWGALEAMRVLARLLEAIAGTPGEGDDGGWPEEYPPVVIRTEAEVHRDESRRTWPKTPLPERWRN